MSEMNSESFGNRIVIGTDVEREGTVFLKTLNAREINILYDS